MNTITIKDTIRINIPAQKLFALMLTLDTQDIMKGYAFLPSVVDIKDQTGRWDIPGAVRVLPCCLTEARHLRK